MHQIAALPNGANVELVIERQKDNHCFGANPGRGRVGYHPTASQTAFRLVDTLKEPRAFAFLGFSQGRSH